MAQPAQTKKLVVAVTPTALAAKPRLFEALETAYPLAFAPLGADGSPDAAIIVADGSSASGPAGPLVDGRAVPAIVFEDDGRAEGPVDDVRVLDHSAVDQRVRGVSLLGQFTAGPLRPAEGDEVLAVDGSGVRWAMSPGPTPAHRVAGTLPELGPDEILRVALQNERSVSVVALTHLLRGLCAGSDFSAPPLRATIVFDDPNVRWSTYGFIDYGPLVRHADAHNYHAVMAMVPRDAGSAHGPTVSLFRRRADRLSLTYHGNSHTKEELLQPRDRVSAMALCAEALRRVSKFEARTGLPVDRVMTPPHGLCSESVAWALAAVGFDALCAINPEPWSQLPSGDQYMSGWGPATFAGPLAVIPRFSLTASSTEIALRAYMDGPLVLYGHHDDLASGLDLLEQAAGRVNALGDVQWMSLGDIARSNVTARTAGDTAVVRPYAAHVRLRLPAAARKVVVEEPSNSRASLRGWSLCPGDEFAFDGPAVRVDDGAEIDLRLVPEMVIDANTVPAPTWRPWTSMRRVVAEARDRLMPLRPARH
jgi:hypothetical protein